MKLSSPENEGPPAARHHGARRRPGPEQIRPRLASFQVRAGDGARSEIRLWLVGHRALRTVPRVAALWDFLAERILAAARLGLAEWSRRNVGCPVL